MVELERVEGVEEGVELIECEPDRGTGAAVELFVGAETK